MDFKFSNLCDLLTRLEKITCHDPPYLPKDRRARLYDETKAWFNSHRKAIDALDVPVASALLSALLPERRKDRVYGIQSPALAKLLSRSLALNASRARDLLSYAQPGNGDLAQCLERVLANGGPPAQPPVTIKEVDDFLQYLASQNRFSASFVEGQPTASGKRDEKYDRLRNLILRLDPCHAKWLVRLILKNYGPVVLEDALVLRSYHFLLPYIIRIQNNIDAAFDILRGPLRAYPSKPDPQSAMILRQTAAASIRPFPGVMVSRPDFVKARSIKQCLQVADRRTWLVERKYDGEYCQIHVDLSQEDEWLKIYSKSSRDSTDDRRGLHETIRTCLQIGTDKCKIKQQCILAGEMVVYSDSEKCILPFDKIRQHVTRAGVCLGTDHDSLPRDDEHLMIIFYDVLLLDDEVMLTKSIEDRKSRLKHLYRKIEGRAMTAESRIMDFADPASKQHLIKHFGASIAARYEGLVLKPCGVPYLALPPLDTESDRAFPSAVIKLKKDYVLGLGDEADFAVIGAYYDAQEASKRPSLSLSWTHFHLGCLLNATAVERTDARPRYRVVATIAFDQCIPPPVLEKLNADGKFVAESPATMFDVENSKGLRVDAYFSEVFVVEVLGSSYSKPSNAGFYMLRHPRVTKLHGDRTWRECTTFHQLQQAAEKALSAPSDAETQENLIWIEQVERSCKRKLARLSANTTPCSKVTAMTTPRTTPRSSRQSNSRRGSIPAVYVDSTAESPLAPPRLQTFERPRVGKSLTTPFFPTPPTSSPLAPASDNARKRAAHSTQSSRQKKQCLEDMGQDLSGSENALVTPLPSSVQRPSWQMHESNTSPYELVAESHPPVQALQGEVNSSKPGDATGLAHTVDFHKPCLLIEAVIYLGICKDRRSDQLRTLLLQHGALVVEDLKEWDRDMFAHAPLTETVGESQSYPGLRKIVLVDAKLHGQSCSTLVQVLTLNKGKFKESIEVYDVGVLHGLHDKAAGMTPDLLTEIGGQQLQRHAVGRFTFDPEVDHSVFVPSIAESSAETAVAL